jgi:Flp pilus assembly pilin Flp
MNSKLNKRFIGGKKQLGQGMTEYIIIVALIAVAAIGVYSAFGKTVREQMSGVTAGLVGQQARVQASIAAANAASTAGQTQANNTVGLDNYNTQIVKP